MTPDEVKQIVARGKALQTLKEPWKQTWQMLGEYIHGSKEDFLGEHEQGEILTQDLFDTTAQLASRTSGSALLAMLWPDSVNRFRLGRDRAIPDSKVNKEYFEWATQQMNDVFDDPKTGMSTALDEYMNDQVVMATSAIEIDRHPETKLIFRPWSVKHMSIDEGPNGLVDTVYLDLEWPIRKIVKLYGEGNVSKRVLGLLRENKGDQKEKILIAIEPREVKEGAKGNAAMPWQSVHMEVEGSHVLKESGFNDMPIKVTRFNKLTNEIYGRGWGFNALPVVLELNAIWESTLQAVELNLAPALGVIDDGTLGAGIIDRSPNAVNVFNIAGRAGERNPIFPLFPPSEFKQTMNLIERREENVLQHFAIDRLLNFNNKTQMTLGEVQLRLRLQNATLSTVFKRQIAEGVSPTIERSFNLMLEDGHLGSRPEEEVPIGGMAIPPDVLEAMDSGRNVYRIEYFTPATRIMQSEEAEGILRTWEFGGQVGSLKPEALDNLNADVSIKRFSDIVGGPSEMTVAEEDVEKIRTARAEAAAEQAQQEQIAGAAEAARNIGQSGLLPQTQSQGAV